MNYSERKQRFIRKMDALLKARRMFFLLGVVFFLVITLGSTLTFILFGNMFSLVSLVFIGLLYFPLKQNMINLQRLELDLPGTLLRPYRAILQGVKYKGLVSKEIKNNFLIRLSNYDLSKEEEKK